MAKTRKITKASTLAEKRSTTSDGTPRTLAPPTYVKWLPERLRYRKPTPKHPPISKARFILREAVQLLLRHKQAFLAIVAVYALGMLMLVVGFSIGSNFSSVRNALDQVFAGKGQFNSVLLQVFYLFSNANSGTTQLSGLYQSILLVIVSLALIWGLRQAKSGKTFTTKESFYLGMTPLVPFLLAVAIVSIQLLPLSFGAYLYSTLTSYGIVVYWYEQVAAFGVFMTLCYWSLRMISGSIFAPYIATLPGMTPLEAVRSAKELVYGRRLLIWRKLLFLPVFLVAVMAVAVIPFVMFAPIFAPWVFFVLGVLAFAVTHAYLYTLYRELIREK